MNKRKEEMLSFHVKFMQTDNGKTICPNLSMLGIKILVTSVFPHFFTMFSTTFFFKFTEPQDCLDLPCATQSQVLTMLTENAFGNIEGKGDNVGLQHLCLFHNFSLHFVNRFQVLRPI